MTGTTPAVLVQRTINASPERVYRAWLDPAVMTRWFAPSTFSCARAEVDERIGGRISIYHRDETGADVGGAEAEIVELVPNSLISLSWHFVGNDRRPHPDTTSLLKITLVPVDGGRTLLHLSHEQLGGLHVHMPHVADGVQHGWESAVDNLESALGGTR